MLTAAKEETFSAPMVWTDECVLPLAASGVYPKTRVWGSEPENLPCFSATAPLRIELRWGCEESSSKTAVGSGVSFKYDPFGRRIYKSSSSGTSVFAYDGDNLIEEANSSGTAVARYSQGLNIDEPLAMLRSSTTSYYQADGLGSITSLSSGAGSLTQTYTFDSFGKQTASSGSLTNPFQYTARESDPETGLYYYRARYYDPQAGRFLIEDPIGFGGGTNFYKFVRENPILLKDPGGQCATCVAALLGGLSDVGTQLLLNGFKPQCIDWAEAGLSSGLSALGVGIAQRLGKVSTSYGGPTRPTYRFLNLKGVLRVESHPTSSEDPDWLSYPHFHPDFLGKPWSKMHWPLVEPLAGAGAAVRHLFKGQDCECGNGPPQDNFPIPISAVLKPIEN